MILIDLIRLEKPLYVHYSNPDYVYTIRRMLKIAKAQGVLAEICSRLGFSLRSVQRWLPTTKRQIKVKKKITKHSISSLIRVRGDKRPPPVDYEIKEIKRANKKKKALKFNKSIFDLLYLALIAGEDIPDKVPSDQELLELLLKFQDTVGSWKKASEYLKTEEMILFRFRKTGKMRKWNRVLFAVRLAALEKGRREGWLYPNYEPKITKETLREAFKRLRR